MIHNRYIKGFKNYDMYDSDYIYGFNMYEGVLDVKDMQKEFTDKWEQINPSNILELKKFLNGLEEFKKYKISFNVITCPNKSGAELRYKKILKYVFF